jgi:hypothetical protein
MMYVKLTLDVDARTFTTPVTSYGDMGASENNDDDGGTNVSSTVVPLEMGFDHERRSHHSAPIVHSLS